MADYVVDANGKITKTSDNWMDDWNQKKKKKKKTPDYVVDINGNISKTSTDDDIAPVKEEKRTWFNSGRFSDGYQFGDVTKTILGTAGDLLEDATAGILGMGETALDFLATGSTSMGVVPYTMFDDEKRQKYVDMANEFVAKDLYNEQDIAKAIISAPIKKGTGFDIEASSVFGDRIDSLAGSAGQLAATAGLQAVGVPWFLTMGATSFGGQMEQALNEGASNEEAVGSALISAGAEVLTERLGGIKFGGKTLTDDLLKPLTNKIASKTGRILADYGIDAVGEGAEEIVSSVFSRLGTKLYKEESIGELLTSEEAMDEYLESFIGGMALGGGMNVINTAIESKKPAMTENEKKVVDQEVKNRIAKEEANGQKLTEQEKKKIRETVESDLDKGYISIDTIESTLGGDTYKAYKSAVENEDSLTKEYKALNQLKQSDMTGEQLDRRAELKQQLDDLKKTDSKRQLKDRLSFEVEGMAMSDRLGESYIEQKRKSQAYSPDLTKYDSKQQEVVKRAMESGVLNNTNRTHEFVDMLSKVSADVGASFDFTNNEKLKAAGVYMEGKTVNGFVQNGNITLNIDSNKALNTIAGHEITHVLEKAGSYEDFHEVLKAYATSKGDYEARYALMAELYKDVETADIAKETTADLAGDYLFTDQEFINSLSKEKPNLFKRIYDEIKYLWKVATAGSKEKRELEKVKKMFAKAYQEAGQKTSEVKYSIGEIVDQHNKSYGVGVHLDSTLLDDLSPKERLEMVKEYVKELGGDSFTAYDSAGNAIHITIEKSNVRFKNKNGKAVPVNKDLTTKYVDNEVKQESIALVDELIVTSGFSGSKAPKYPHGWLDNNGQNDWEYWTTYIQDKNNTIWEATLNVANAADGRKILYDINPIKKVGRSVKSDTTPTDVNIAQTDPNVKRKNSLSEAEKIKDSNGDQALRVMSGGSVAKYSLSTWTPDVQTKVRSNLLSAGFDDRQVDKWIKDTNGIAAVIASDKDRLDFEAHDNHTMVKNNQEYIKTVEASTLCAKRLEYQGTFDAIQHRLPNTVITSDMIIELREMMKKKGYDVPCGACYVESRRRHLGKFAGEWLSKYKGDYIPTLDEVTTSDGLERLRVNHPQTYRDFIDAMNAKGSANPKVVQLRTEYQGEILDITDAEYKKIMKIGGLRLQSFSDFETPHLLDMMQVVNDMASRGFVSQAYTKVPNFAWVFGDTNVKINLSLIPSGTGLDADGNLTFDNKEGMDFDEAMRLRDRYSQNVGTIVIGINDAHILAAMADDRIDFIIPFHRSGWGKNELKAMGLDSYTDYTKTQKERYIETGKGAPNIDEMSYWDFSKTGKENAETYLRLCAEKGVVPKFDTFLVNNGDGSYSLQSDGSTDGYWKTLINFKMYDNDGVGSPHQKVLPNFNMEEAYRVLAEYEGGANDLPVANDVVEEFVSKYGEIVPTYSLSDDTAPTREYGNYNIYGKDIKYQDIAPVQEATPVQTAVTPDVAPVVDEPSEEPPFDDYDEAWEEVVSSDLEGDTRIRTVKERLSAKLENFQTELDNNINLRNESNASYDEEIARLEAEYASKKNKDTAVANNILRRIERLHRMKGNVDADYAKRISDLEERVAKTSEELRTGQSTSEQGAMRSELHASIINNAKAEFEARGLDLDETFKNAKNLSTFSTVDNTPQRVMEKALGYKEGQALADITVNKVAQNETEGIRWLNSYTDRKTGQLAVLSKRYNIKPGSKESAAAQMYAEGFYVDANNNIIEYGDRELAMDFPDARVRENIKGLSRDPMIRQIYDETLDMINASRARNAYPEIQKLKNYFLHFRAMDDTFSKLGLPFNPNDIRAKDLPTDLNGVTADLKPGQPYFASAMHRTGQRTSFDLLGGLERYLTSAKNQIYHIDDIQTLRAIRNYIADNYGQAKGLESLDTMTEEEAQDRIQRVYNSHLSTFAKFLNEEANVIAGKTALIDRGIEGIIGRRGITFLNTVNGQVGKNMVGFNVSSSLTNFLPVVQTFAKSNKASFVKAFAQTVSNKLGSIAGKSDGFAEQSPVMIRRKGADAFYRTPFQKVGDAGYALMSAVDNISTELIARTKYNELVKNGMDSETAHVETDKWVSRLMGDRSLGQQPQLYNSKMLGLVTKFQLEVRNQLDSQFYDTIQEAKASNEDIQNGLKKNAKTAAKVASTFVQLAVVQHLFGKAFESVAGYNPAFDIIEVLITALGFDDDEESEDTALDNIEQGFLALLEDLPYASTVMDGGRIPISDAMPIGQFIKGVDEYGNEKSRWDIATEVAPYYILPGGYGQYKKTKKGLDMFSDEHPISGSYTDSGNLRFPVDDTLKNRVQAGIFGQWANENARDYFDNGRDPLKEKQIQEFIDLDMPIRDYWDYREGLKEQETLEDKFEYVAGQDLSVKQKNIMINNIVDRKEKVDMSNYDDFANFEEFDFYTKNTEKYNFLQANNVSYKEYKSSDEAKKEYDTIYNWAKQNPEKVVVSKLVMDNVVEYRRLVGTLDDIPADKNAKGNSINGSRKAKVTDYINGLDLDYGQKIILFRSQYDKDDTYNADIVEYLNSLDYLSYEDIVEILTELNFKVRADGTVTWD